MKDDNLSWVADAVVDEEGTPLLGENDELRAAIKGLPNLDTLRLSTLLLVPDAKLAAVHVHHDRLAPQERGLHEHPLPVKAAP